MLVETPYDGFMPTDINEAFSHIKPDRKVMIDVLVVSESPLAQDIRDWFYNFSSWSDDLPDDQSKDAEALGWQPGMHFSRGDRKGENDARFKGLCEEFLNNLERLPEVKSTELKVYRLFQDVGFWIATVIVLLLVIAAIF